MDTRLISAGATLLMIGVILIVFLGPELKSLKTALGILESVLDEGSEGKYTRTIFLHDVGKALVVLGPLVMLGGAISKAPPSQPTYLSHTVVVVAVAGLVSMVLMGMTAVLTVMASAAGNAGGSEDDGSGDSQQDEAQQEDEEGAYDGGEVVSAVSGDLPEILVSGPYMANIGDTIVVSIKNGGNVDLVQWATSGVLTESGGPLTHGSQRSFSVTLRTYPLWVIRAAGVTRQGETCEDVLAIREP